MKNMLALENEKKKKKLNKTEALVLRMISLLMCVNENELNKSV